MANKNTVEIWRGQSLIDGAPIVVLMSGLRDKSGNEKCGPDMLQTYIVRADVSPLDAVKSGADFSICGDCKHRGMDGAPRTCYVNMRTPKGVWRSWRNGKVSRATFAQLAPQLAGRPVRIGAYGDPAAVPTSVWRQLVALCAGHTGYTHQWQWADLRGLVMASADSESEQLRARDLGYRVFRVKTPDMPLLAREISCPASEEAGKRTSCQDCRLCSGSTGVADLRANVAINVHGNGTRAFIRLQSVA